MSKDRTTEMLNYLSAISREVGEFRQEFNKHRDETNTRLDKVEQRLGGVEGELVEIKREQRKTRQQLDRMHGLLLSATADIAELDDRVVALEGEQA